MKVSIIGQGYVGLTISAFAIQHYEVVGFDINADLVAQLAVGKSHVEGVDLAGIGNYKATGDALAIEPYANTDAATIKNKTILPIKVVSINSANLFMVTSF